MASHIPAERIERRIFVLREQKVMLDADLAMLYGVPTKVLNQAVKRNLLRFPADFMFQLTREEHDGLRSQSVTLKRGRGRHRKYLPYAFTEQGVAMLSSVLRSRRAVLVNVEIMRAFVRLRALAFSYKDLANKIRALEAKYDAHDFQIREIFEAIRALMTPPPPGPNRPIGFRPQRQDRE
jgi:ORF6N domain